MPLKPGRPPTTGFVFAVLTVFRTIRSTVFTLCDGRVRTGRNARVDFMDSKRLPATGKTISLAEKVAFSNRFNKLFSDGMALVEESATYLDGEGRREAKTLPKSSVVLYGTESMRLTTRLMQLASWLLLQRAANEGEMTAEQFREEKKKVKLDTLPVTGITDEWEQLPPRFTDLVSRSLALQTRITTIDAEVYEMKKAIPADDENPVRQQINLLSTALGAKNTLN